jgi:hypothetical protein
MPGELLSPFGFSKLTTANPGSQRCALDQSRDMLVGQPVSANGIAASGQAPEQWSVSDAGEFQPSLKGSDRTRPLTGAAADLDLSPSSLAAHMNEGALFYNLDPASAIRGLIRREIEPYDLTAAQTTGETDR